MTNLEIQQLIEDLEAFTYTLPRDLQERVQLALAALESEPKPLLEFETEMEQAADSPTTYFLHVEECFELAEAEGQTLFVSVTVRERKGKP